MLYFCRRVSHSVSHCFDFCLLSSTFDGALLLLQRSARIVARRPISLKDQPASRFALAGQLIYSLSPRVLREQLVKLGGVCWVVAGAAELALTLIVTPARPLNVLAVFLSAATAQLQ